MDKWQVIYYVSESGDNPVSDFLDSLKPETQNKIIRILHNVEEYGLDSVIPHVKKLSGTPLWEIRVLGQVNIRVIYVIPVQLKVLVLHGFLKKKQKTPLKEIAVATKRYQQYLRKQKSS